MSHAAVSGEALSFCRLLPVEISSVLILQEIRGRKGVTGAKHQLSNQNLDLFESRRHTLVVLLGTRGQGLHINIAVPAYMLLLFLSISWEFM